MTQEFKNSWKHDDQLRLLLCIRCMFCNCFEAVLSPLLCTIWWMCTITDPSLKINNAPSGPVFPGRWSVVLITASVSLDVMSAWLWRNFGFTDRVSPFVRSIDPFLLSKKEQKKYWVSKFSWKLPRTNRSFLRFSSDGQLNSYVKQKVRAM